MRKIIKIIDAKDSTLAIRNIINCEMEYSSFSNISSDFIISFRFLEDNEVKMINFFLSSVKIIKFLLENESNKDIESKYIHEDVFIPNELSVKQFLGMLNYINKSQ